MLGAAPCGNAENREKTASEDRKNSQSWKTCPVCTAPCDRAAQREAERAIHQLRGAENQGGAVSHIVQR